MLGGVVIADHASARLLPPDRRGALLAYLAYDGGWVERDRLVVLFWPDSDESSAKRNLRQLLLRARRLELDPPVEVTPQALRWSVPTDVQSFRASLAAGDTVAAVDLYRGALLEGLTLEDGRGFEAWLEAERAGLQAAFHAAGMREAERATVEGRFEDAVAALTRLRAGDPLAEDVIEASMRALYLSGRRDAALDLYQRFETDLDEELGLEPLSSTRELLDQIRDDRPLSVAQPRAATTSVPRRDLKPTRLFGRDRERALLLAAATPVVLVAGEPGIGKSALLGELYPTALATAAHEGLERMPYHPFAALLRAKPALVDAAGPYREDLARLVPELAPGAAPQPVDPDTARLRVAEALAHVAAVAGAPVAIDDMQWADPATLECLVYLSARGQQVLGAYREQEVGAALAAALAGWRSRDEATVVRLEPIGEPAVRAFMADLIGTGEGPRLFSRRLWQRTGGNPMFLLETLRSLFDAGVLLADDDGWHTAIDDITVDYSELDVPARVTEVIGRRLERLDNAAQRVLEVFALAPVPLSTQVLAKITGLSSAATAAALDAAEGAGFIAAGRFRHDLLRETTAARVSHNRRVVTHALLAKAYAEELGDGADHGVLAEQWWLAADHGEARRHWLVHVAQLRSRGLHLAALDVLADASARLAPGEDLKWLRVAAAETALEGGWYDRAAELLADLALADDDAPELHAKLTLARSAWLFNTGNYLQAEAHVNASRHWFSLVSDENLLLDLVMMDARIATQRQELQRAVDLITPVVEKMRTQRPSSRRAQFVTSLAALQDQLERHEDALLLHKEALAIAKNVGSRYMTAEASLNLLYCLADLGRHEEAIEFGEAALASTTSDNEPLVRINLAAHYRESGRLSEAITHYRHLAESGPPHLQVIALARWAEAEAHVDGGADQVVLIDRLLECLPFTDYPVALGVAAIAVHKVGSEAQLADWRQYANSLDPNQLPTYLRAELTGAIGSRGVAPTAPGE